MNLSLYYLIIKIKRNYEYDWSYHNFIKIRSYFDFICDAIFGTFMGYKEYTAVTWTMPIELWGTFALFLVILIATNYRTKFLFYFAPCVFCIMAVKLVEPDENSKLPKLLNEFHLFIIGAAFSYSECGE